MGTIGVIGAMEEEVGEIKSKIEVIAIKNMINTDFYIGKMNNNNIVVARCGIGKVNAAICTQVLIDIFAVDVVLNTGVAGAVKGNINIGDIVISEDVAYHDFFVNEPGVIPRMEESFFKGEEDLINLAKEACEEVLVNNKYYVDRIATGDFFISSKKAKDEIFSNVRGACVDMESCAIGQTCYLNKIPFLIIRSISDNADDNASISFDKFVKVAAKKSSDIIEYMVNRL